MVPFDDNNDGISADTAMIDGYDDDGEDDNVLYTVNTIAILMMEVNGA